MWIILFFICGSVILPNKAQDLTSVDIQGVTQTPYANNAMNWESTRPPVTLTIRNGRTDQLNHDANDNSNIPLFYSNQWQPLLMPIGFNGNEDEKKRPDEIEYSVNQQFVPTYLRRPDSEINDTLPYYSLEQPRNEFRPLPIQFSPIFYYSTQNNSTTGSEISDKDQKYSQILAGENAPSNVENFESLNVYRATQEFGLPTATSANYPSTNTFSDAVESDKNNQDLPPLDPKPKVSESTVSRVKDNYNNRLHRDSFLPLSERLPSMNGYRYPQGFIPPMVPAYFNPYQFLPYLRDGAYPPLMPYPPTDLPYDREAGLAIRDRGQDVPEKVVDTQNVSETVPRETSTNAVPPPPLPWPVGAFPFGVLPPPFMPPLIPNTPVSGGVLTNPLPFLQPRSVRKETVVPEIVPPSPAGPPRLPLEINREIIPPSGYIDPVVDTSLLSEPKIVPEDIIPEEKPNTEKIPYEFGFDMNDGKGNDQHRKEVSDISGVVTGSYGYRDAFGVYRIVNYIADKDGFRAFIKSNEPGVASSGSADVVVMAEQPPPRAIAEGIKATEPELIVTPDAVPNLLPLASNLDSK